jgi:hypothetical protein
MHSWRVLLLPYLGQVELYNDYNFAEPWDGPNNKGLLTRRPGVFAFPGDDADGGTVTNYLAVVGAETFWPGAKSTNIKDIKDGYHLTIVVVENEGSGIRWTEPRDLDFTKVDLMLKDPIRHGISSKLVPPAVLMGDGCTRRMPNRPKRDILKALFTIAGREQIDEDDSWEEIPDGRLRPKKP